MTKLPEGGEPVGPLSGDDLARLTDQIAGLTRAGLPLPSGVRALGEELPPGRLRGVMGRLARMLESGLPLEVALEQQGSRLPPHFRGLVGAAARTGKLGEVLGRFAGYTSVGVDLRRSLWIRLAYPLVSVAFGTAIFVFVCAVLLNGFSKVFNDFGIPLPLITRLVMGMAAAVGRAWWPLLQGLLGLLTLLALASAVLSVDVRRGLAWGIPLIGPVWYLSDLAEFSHLLALLLESEVPLAEALTLAGEGVRNNEIGAASKAAARDVDGGRPLALALTRRALFPGGFGRILGWAEKHHGLPEALHMAGEMFEARARSQATFVSLACSVMAMVTLLFGVVVMVLAIFVPMINLLTRLSG